MQTEPVDITEQQEECWEVLVKVHNTGLIPDREFVQLYSWRRDCCEERELRAFEKTQLLAPGAVGVVRLTVRWRSMAHWREECWVLGAGGYVLGIGKNAGDIGSIAGFMKIQQRLTWRP